MSPLDAPTLTDKGLALPFPPGCPGHVRHWFTVRGHVGLRSPKCVRCGAPNPRQLTTDDWRGLLDYAPHLLDNPEGIRRSLDDEDYV